MNWINEIITKFPNKPAMYLIKDIDGLLGDEQVQNELTQNDFVVLTFDDPVLFRYTYEKNYSNFDGTLIIRLIDAKYSDVPFDVFKDAYEVSLSLTDIFANLDCSVVRDADNALYDSLLSVSQSLDHKLNRQETNKTVNSILAVSEKMKITQLKFNVDFESYGFDEWGKWSQEIGNALATNPELVDNAKLTAVNRYFQEWLRANFDLQANRSYFNAPKSVSQINNYVNSKESGNKVALLVMDGMSFTQWTTIQTFIGKKGYISSVSSVLSMIPSITSVSRQTIFSGLLPKQFADSIDTTNKEPSRWMDFWENEGFSDSQIKYARKMGHDISEIESLGFNNPFASRFGGVIDVVDKYIHSAQQGVWSIQSELTHWLESGYLIELLERLTELDFEIYMTSDHGNVEATGIGNIREGALVITQGKRVRLYNDPGLRSEAEEKFADSASIWDSNYLPENMYPLEANDKLAFAPKGDKIVTHGGTNIEEVFVPFVKIAKGD